MGELGNIVDEMHHNRKLSTRYKTQVAVATKYAEDDLRSTGAPTSTFQINVGHFRDFEHEILSMERELEGLRAMLKDSTLLMATAVDAVLKPKNFEEYYGQPKEWKPYVITFKYQATSKGTFVSDIVFLPETVRGAWKRFWRALRRASFISSIENQANNL